MKRVTSLSPLRLSNRPFFASTRLQTTLNFDQIREELLARSLNIIEDWLSPTNSKLLSLTLSEFLPPACQAPPYGLKDKTHLEYLFPQGHHLVYFPAHTSLSKLLSDGTDTLQSPGAPFVRRMWAGGSVQFGTDSNAIFRAILKKIRRAVCIEGIRDVRVKGLPNEEKVFVDIERQYRHTKIKQPPALIDIEKEKARFREGIPGDITEKRTLVFMRGDVGEQASTQGQRFLRSPDDPEFNMQLTPTRSLLFRFSALTFNAHQIHLSSHYASQVEGHRDMVVHGPLTLVVLLSLLRSQLGYRELVSSFSYRNLAPLYVNEMMNVCGKKRPDGTFLMWIEDARGSLAVKGEATIATLEELPSTAKPSEATKTPENEDTKIKDIETRRQDKPSTISPPKDTLSLESKSHPVNPQNHMPFPTSPRLAAMVKHYHKNLTAPRRKNRLRGSKSITRPLIRRYTLTSVRKVPTPSRQHRMPLQLQMRHNSLRARKNEFRFRSTAVPLEAAKTPENEGTELEDMEIREQEKPSSIPPSPKETLSLDSKSHPVNPQNHRPFLTSSRIDAMFQHYSKNLKVRRHQSHLRGSKSRTRPLIHCYTSISARKVPILTRRLRMPRKMRTNQNPLRARKKFRFKKVLMSSRKRMDPLTKVSNIPRKDLRQRWKVAFERASLSLRMNSLRARMRRKRRGMRDGKEDDGEEAEETEKKKKREKEEDLALLDELKGLLKR